MKMHSKEEILETLSQTEFGAVATLEDGQIKTRTMHFAVDPDFNFYLATLKVDPKIKQLLANPSASLLLIKGDKGFFEAKEVEVSGQAEVLNKPEDRKAAFELLAPRSPVVKNMQDGGALDLLAVLKVSPKSLKYREVPEIIRGVGPTVLDFAQKERATHYYFGWESFKKSITNWTTEIRVPFLTATLVPVLLGTAIAWARLDVFNLTYFILTLLGISCLHAGTNIINDYFDHASGNDEVNTEYVRPFSGGSRMIQLGRLSPKQVLAAALLFFAFGSFIGLYLTYALGPVILILGMIGVFSGYFYSAPPFRLANHGLGELVVGVNFGILVTLGAYFVQAGQLALEPALAAIPVSLLIAAVLYINEFPDFTADKAVGKNNILVRLGKEKGAYVYSILMGLIFVSVPALVALGKISPFTLIIFLVLPRVLRAMRVTRLNFNQTLYLIPANADTVLSHLYGGLLLSAGYLLQKIILG
jgi:1,4-dihydroxy-2-naphthoate octaprenyltransferase